MTRGDLFLLVGVALAVLGLVRVLTTPDLVRRVIALNVASGGVLMVLLVVAVTGGALDPVPQALTLTGIVITVAVTGFALVLARTIEAADDDDAHREDSRTQNSSAQNSSAQNSATQNSGTRRPGPATGSGDQGGSRHQDQSQDRR